MTHVYFDSDKIDWSQYFRQQQMGHGSSMLGGRNELDSDEMTVPRGLWILAMLAVIGIATVAIQGESAKVANRIQRLHYKQVVLEQTLWTQDMELARLRGPDEIRRRLAELGLNVLPPPKDPGVKDNGKASD